MKAKIQNLNAIQVYDSRGRPAVEVQIEIEDGTKASFISPSGASVGSAEAIELRESNEKGFSNVTRAVNNVINIIKPSLIGIDVTQQVVIDELLISLDGTKNKSKLGANAILPTSFAALQAAAKIKKMPLFEYLGGIMSNMLPTPMVNFLNGGMHADNSIEIQEFMLMPVSADSFSECMEMLSAVSFQLQSILLSKGYGASVGDEGGYSPDIKSCHACFDILGLAVSKAGYKMEKDFLFAIDVAASGLYNNGRYEIEGQKMTSSEMIDFYEELIRNYPIFSIEDPMSEDDHQGFIEMTQRLGDKLQIVGDDYFVTDPRLIEEGVSNGACNSVLIKPNQIGTISETLDALSVCQASGYSAIISHRSGDTEESAIAHLALGGNCIQVKFGGLMRSERLAKYNELIRISDLLGHSAVYSGSLIKEKYKAFRKSLQSNSAIK